MLLIKNEPKIERKLQQPTLTTDGFSQEFHSDWNQDDAVLLTEENALE